MRGGGLRWRDGCTKPFRWSDKAQRQPYDAKGDPNRRRIMANPRSAHRPSAEAPSPFGAQVDV
jgi:hypothetical protein